MSDYLFPVRMNRRDFLAAGIATTAALTVGTVSAEEEKPVVFGEGKWRYVLDTKWGKLPDGMKYGLGCGIVVDSKDRVYVTSRSTNPCVAIFSREGELLETWSKDFSEKVGLESTKQVSDTAHCLYWSKEGNDEFLYFTENVHAPKGQKKLGCRVYKTDLKGKVLFTIGNVDKESDTSKKFDWTNPTDVAIAPNLDIYVVDGYGSQRVSRFDKDFKHIKTIGGKGKEHGKFNTCHGVWISTLNKEPEVYIADRENGRYEVYSLELEYKRTVSGNFVRRPCCFYQHNGHLYIPDLGALVTIIDKDDKMVAMLGDGKGIQMPEFEKGHPDKFAYPHALTVDSQGNIYVLEWVPYGRVRKLKHEPKA
jgi:peptidylamidoglycolate lyase